MSIVAHGPLVLYYAQVICNRCPHVRGIAGIVSFLITPPYGDKLMVIALLPLRLSIGPNSIKAYMEYYNWSRHSNPLFGYNQRYNPGTPRSLRERLKGYYPHISSAVLHPTLHYTNDWCISCWAVQQKTSVHAFKNRLREESFITRWWWWGGGGAVTFSRDGQNKFTTPQIPLEKNLDPPRYMTKMFVPPPPIVNAPPAP